MKPTMTTFVSLDGVMQGIGSPEENPGGGFTRGGWPTTLMDTTPRGVTVQTYWTGGHLQVSTSTADRASTAPLSLFEG